MREGPIVVVGGGPAGSLAAMLLARAGRRVILVDRGPAGRDKCCGCCLSARALPMLDEAGVLGVVRSAARDDTMQWRVWGPEPLIRQSFSGHRGLVVPRREMDVALLEEARRAGVEILQPASAQLDESGGVLVRSEDSARGIGASLVVGADGLGSGIARRAGLTGVLHPGRKYGFACTFEGIDPGLLEVDEGTIEMHLGEPGYLGLVRSGRGIHAAALVERKRVTRASPLEILRGFARGSRALAPLMDARGEDRAGSRNAGPLHAATITAAGPMPWRPAAVASDRVALIGDAAGYVEPFTGEGMTWAFESAILLARVVLRVGAWSRRTAEIYALEYARAFAARHRRCRRVSTLLERPRTFAACARVGSKFPALTAWMVRRVVAA